MTTEPRRALAALALVPVAAGAFAGSVAWAAEHSPANGSSGSTTAAAPVTGAVGAAEPVADPQMVEIAGQLDALGARLAAVQAELDARATQAVAVAPSAPSVAAPAPRSQPAPQPAQQAAPPVDTTTRASG